MVPENNVISSPQSKGSLNNGQRKINFNNIDKQNKKMVSTLMNAKPSVGSNKDWKKHEERHSCLKSKIKGMHLQKEYKGFCSPYNNKNSIENFNQGNTSLANNEFKSPLS